MCKLTCGLAVLLLVLSTSRLQAEPDLRQQFGTRSLEAAKHIDATIKLENSKRPEEALKEIDAAIAGDPSCALAWLWKGEVCKDLGDIDQSIDAYKHCVALDVDPTNRAVTTTAKSNMGLLFGQLKRFDESAYWFARAIVDDADDTSKEQAKAYRNLALTLHFQGHDFPALLAAITGQEIDPARVEDGLIDDLSKHANGQEGARVLALEPDVPKVTARTAPAKLTALSIVSDIAERITQIFADPRGQYLIALADKSNHYYVVELHAAANPSVRKVSVAGSTITTGCLMEGRLFVVVSSPMIVELDPLSGKTVRSWNLTNVNSTTSLAVLPSKNAAFFPANNHIQYMNLQDGKVADSGIPGQVVTADPREDYVYARYKGPATSNDHMVIIDGHPIFIQNDHFDWNQTTLFKLYVAPHKLLPAAVRVNAAANGYDVVVSPDGNWVSCPGGGGWRPDAGGGGYVIPVFPMADFNTVLKSFAIDAYPINCAFNPVTQQFAGIRNADAKIYHLGGDASKPEVTLSGSFGGPCSWSGDGRYLVTARNDKGINIHQNDLSPEEIKTAQVWWKKIVPAKSSIIAKADNAANAGGLAHRVVDALVKYQPASDRGAVQRSLAAALASKSTDKALEWRKFPTYASDAASIAVIDDLAANSAETGVRIYELKKALAKTPGSTPVKFYLAEAMLSGGQAEGAQPRFLDVIHSDAGRTELTGKALAHLSACLVKAGNDLSAVDCLAQSLTIDRADHDAIAALTPLLRKLKFADEENRFVRETPAASTGGVTVPPLVAPPASAALSPAKLFAAAAPSVVLIQCGNSSGTAVCVGKDGVLLTSRHVVACADHIDVYPFAIENGRARRLGKHSAAIVAESEKHDLAILRMETPPPALIPLPVAQQSPAVGEKVFALGNPGLGRQTLDLSFSEGIVSSVDRTVQGNTYLQHTAAVNPGNSGGPLISETGVVVGLVCLKADLDGVSFGTPVETIRAFYAQHVADQPPK